MEIQQPHLNSIENVSIRCKAKQLIRRPEFTIDEIEDIKQELTLHVFEHRHKFDPQIAKYTTFFSRLIDNKVSNMIRYRKQAKRDCRRANCSLNDHIFDEDGETIERAATISQDEIDMRADRRHRNINDETDFQIDISQVLAALPENLRQIAKLLMKYTIAEVVRRCGIPRSTFYDKYIKPLEKYLEDKDLDKYL